MLTPIAREELSDFMREGQTLEIFCYTGSASNRKFEIRAIVDGEWVVTATKASIPSPVSKPDYRIDHISFYVLQAKRGRLFHDPGNPAPLSGSAGERKGR